MWFQMLRGHKTRTINVVRHSLVFSFTPFHCFNRCSPPTTCVPAIPQWPLHSLASPCIPLCCVALHCIAWCHPCWVQTRYINLAVSTFTDHTNHLTKCALSPALPAPIFTPAASGPTTFPTIMFAVVISLRLDHLLTSSSVSFTLILASHCPKVDCRWTVKYEILKFLFLVYS